MKKLLFVLCVVMMFVFGVNAVMAEADYLQTTVPSSIRDATVGSALPIKIEYLSI